MPPAGGIDMTNMTRGIIAISVGYSAYMAEIFRSGIEAIPKGQLEAGSSLGLSRWQTARLIVLPQALRIVTPPLGNEFIAMIKGHLAAVDPVCARHDPANARVPGL